MVGGTGGKKARKAEDVKGFVEQVRGSESEIKGREKKRGGEERIGEREREYYKTEGKQSTSPYHTASTINNSGRKENNEFHW